MDIWQVIHDSEHGLKEEYFISGSRFGDLIEDVKENSMRKYHNIMRASLVETKAEMNFYKKHAEYIGDSTFYVEGLKSKKRKPKDHVYFLRCAEDYVKIGKTENLKNRISAISMNTPFETELVHTIKTNFGYQLEKAIQGINEDKCVKGEWFYFPEGKSRRIEAMKQLNSFHFFLDDFDSQILQNKLKNYFGSYIKNIKDEK